MTKTFFRISAKLKVCTLAHIPIWLLSPSSSFSLYKFDILFEVAPSINTEVFRNQFLFYSSSFVLCTNRALAETLRCSVSHSAQCFLHAVDQQLDSRVSVCHCDAVTTWPLPNLKCGLLHVIFACYHLWRDALATRHPLNITTVSCRSGHSTQAKSWFDYYLEHT